MLFIMKVLANQLFCSTEYPQNPSTRHHGLGGYYIMENLLNVTNQNLDQITNKQTAYKLK